MSEDRELLELAAKAAGYAGASWFKDSLLVPHATENRRVSWNPLTDDGDALRLAVDLKIDLDFDEDNPLVEAYHKLRDEPANVCTEVIRNNRSGVRRAIVRAAAALAKKE